MKHTYSFLAGVASISLTVFLTNCLPGYMFLAGFCVCSLSVVLLGRAVGATRLARLFLRYADQSGVAGPAKGSNSVVSSVAENGKGSASGGWGTGISQQRYQARKRGPKEIRIRRNPSSAENANNRGVVNSVDVLSSVQQDVLSALVNLKVPYSQAEEAIRGARGRSFDELFREALTSVNAGAGKSRRAVA